MIVVAACRAYPQCGIQHFIILYSGFTYICKRRYGGFFVCCGRETIVLKFSAVNSVGAWCLVVEEREKNVNCVFNLFACF